MVNTIKCSALFFGRSISSVIYLMMKKYVSVIVSISLLTISSTIAMEKEINLMSANTSFQSTEEEIESIKDGLCFTGIIVNTGKMNSNKVALWKESGFNRVRP